MTPPKIHTPTPTEEQPYSELTQLLEAWRKGDAQAAEALFPQIQPELRKIAAGYLRMERRNHTLQPTALVNEAYLRLIDQHPRSWQNRSHFYAIAAKTIRRILIDHARRALTAKRGRDFERVSTFEAEALPSVETPAELLQLHEALERLRQLDPRQEAIVEYRYFGGMTGVEIARVLGCSPVTVKRHWRLAKAWLYREMKKGARSG